MIPPGILLLNGQLRELSIQLREKNLSWFSRKGIDVISKKFCWLLNKNPYSEHNHWNNLTHGMILDLGGTVWSFPFTTIHALGRKEAPTLEFESCDMIEKLRGELVVVAFPYSDIARHFYHTKSWTCDDDDVNGELVRELDSLVDKLKFNYCDFDSIFIFEHVREPYPKERQGLHLIGSRRLSDYAELSEIELDSKATVMNANRPEKWHNLTSWSDVKRIINESPSEFEGFILRNKKTGKRIKFEKEFHTQERPVNIFVKWKHNLPIDSRHKGVVAKIEESFKDRMSFLRRQISSWRVTFGACKNTDQLIRRNSLRMMGEVDWAQKFILQFADGDFNDEDLRKEMLNLPDDILKKILGVP